MVSTARSRQGLDRRNAQIQALNELGQAMNSGLDLDESLELIVARAAEALYSQIDEGIDSTYEKRIAEFVAATGEPILIDDLRTDEEPNTRFVAVVCPPRSGGECRRHTDATRQDLHRSPGSVNFHR
jgi:hypothetical protein